MPLGLIRRLWPNGNAGVYIFHLPPPPIGKVFKRGKGEKREVEKKSDRRNLDNLIIRDCSQLKGKGRKKERKKKRKKGKSRKGRRKESDRRNPLPYPHWKWNQCLSKFAWFAWIFQKFSNFWEASPLHTTPILCIRLLFCRTTTKPLLGKNCVLSYSRFSVFIY